MSSIAVIVEDNSTSADLIARQLQAVGFNEALISETAEEGITLIEETSPNLVVIDERLPDASGTELIRMVRDQMPDVAIIMCTVVDDESLMEAAFAAGCNYYTVKPNGLRHLCSQRGSVEDLLDLRAQEVYR
jgi:DNA-binding response OmpR family regulator